MNDRTPVTPQKGRMPSPFRDFGAIGAPMDWLRGEIDRLFEGFGQPSASLFNFGGRPDATPLPAVEVSHDEKSYTLTAELPGLTEKDVDISVADGVLRIAAEKKEEDERKDKGLLFSERRYGSFERQIALPADVDQNGITAQFKDGLLTVTLAKDQQTAARSRKIEIGKA